MSISVINNFMLVSQGSLGEVVFPTPGTWQWTCPTGVTAISGVCIGGGGGGESVLQSPIDDTWSGGGAGWGGSLIWGNNMSVSPGTTYTIQVGSGGTWGNYIDKTGNIIPARSGGDSSIYEPAVNANVPFYPLAVTGDGDSFSYIWFDCRTSPNNKILGNVVASTIVRSQALYSNTRARTGPGLDSNDTWVQTEVNATNLANVRVHISKPVKNYTNQAFYFIGNALIGAGGGSITYSNAVNSGEYPYYNTYGRHVGGGSNGGIGYNGLTGIYNQGSITMVWLQGGGGAGGYLFGGGAGGTNGGSGAQGGYTPWQYDGTNWFPSGAGGGGASFVVNADRSDTEIPVPMAGGGGGTGLYGRGAVSDISYGGAGSPSYDFSTKGGGGQGANSTRSVGGNGTNYPRICRDGINTNTTRTGGDYGGGGGGGVGYWDKNYNPQGGGNGGSGGVRIMWGGGRTYSRY